MKKILLEMYLKKNLGDDLFLKIISEKYPNCIFYVQSASNYKKKYYNKNIKFIRNIFTRSIKFIEKKFKIKKTLIIDMLKKRTDLFIVLGGSMFIENKILNKYEQEKICNKYLKNKKPTYILGANFGPYKTEKYYNLYKNIFKNLEDISFRDKYSYELFNKLKNTRYNPDIVFSLNIDQIKITNEENVIISIIDCSKKFTNDICDKYERMIINMIKLFIKKQLKVTLMSFCKAEGDEEAIQRIIKKIKEDEIKNKLSQYNYNGNINEALNILGNSQIIVGSRFHANILGLVMNKVIIPIAYSDKTINTLRDIEYKGKIIDIRKLNELEVNCLTQSNLNYKINIDQYRRDAEKHFTKLNHILKDKR